MRRNGGVGAARRRWLWKNGKNGKGEEEGAEEGCEGEVCVRGEGGREASGAKLALVWCLREYLMGPRL